jgi:hypothetical protein
MPLTLLERDFLERLAIEPWTGPLLFDHALVARLVEIGYIDTEVLPTGAVRFSITVAGRDGLVDPTN